MRQRPPRFALLLFVLLAFAPSLLAQTLEERLKEIDEYAARAGQEWKVPGFAMAIVKDDRVVFAKGYGVRELGKPDPVDKDTLFAVASNTKPSLPLSSYAGTYTGAMYGDAKVSEENGHLVVRLAPAPDFVGDLELWHFDTFRIKWRDSVVYPFPRGFVTFTLDPQGKPDQMKIDVPNPDFDFKELEFKRAPDARAAGTR
ncbi:MAG: hypothetical protein DMF67_17225 [Acidobacteria bacterium]|nr:MAG: hypothetical protein DMF67_17225 [Acidobacteriota bacterium]